VAARSSRHPNGASSRRSARLRSPGVDPAVAKEAESEVKIGVGDDFDFLDLQKDIDRIRENFHKQGFLEARVRTRRVEAEDARSVAIEFAINRGPKTTLQIDGVTLPSKLVTELEEAWHQNVFDQFLIDDLTHRVRRHLVTSGDLGSVVVGRIDRPDASSKRLRIEVTPWCARHRPRDPVRRQYGTRQRATRRRGDRGRSRR
jgi:hypothetical protein